MSSLTLFHLPGSRSLRIGWLLEELDVPYELVSSTRLPNMQAPPEFMAKIGGLGKVPTIHDGDGDSKIIVQESGAIVEYLCAKYSSPLLPTEPLATRAKILEYVHLAEGTFFLQTTPFFLVRGTFDESAARTAFEAKVTEMVVEDLKWLESELQMQKKKRGPGEGLFLVGKELTAADIMMGFTVDVILGILLEGKRRFEGVDMWLEGLKGREGWKKAYQRLEKAN